jgi:hypothetical protein
MFCPVAAGGRVAVVVKNDPPKRNEPHANLVFRGLFHDAETVQLYAPLPNVPPAAMMSVKVPDPILISSTPASKQLALDDPDGSVSTRCRNERTAGPGMEMEGLTRALWPGDVGGGPGTAAALGGVSTKSVFVTQGGLPVVLQPAGRAGAVMPSKFWDERTPATAEGAGQTNTGASTPATKHDRRR